MRKQILSLQSHINFSVAIWNSGIISIPDPFKIFNVNLFLLPDFETLQTTSYIDVDGTRCEKKAKTIKEKESKICFELLPTCDLHGCDIT